MPRHKGHFKPHIRPSVLCIYQTDQRGTITVSLSHGRLTREDLSHLSAFGVKKARISTSNNEVDLKFASERDCEIMTHLVVNHIIHSLRMRFEVLRPPEVRKIKAI